MASRYSSERSERESGIYGAARCSQPISVSEDCVEPGSGESECRKTADNSVFLGLSERASSEENLRDVSERIPKSELVPLANHSVHGASSDLPEINPRDQSYQRSVLNVRPSMLAVRGDSNRGKRNLVTFNPEVTIHLIPYEDRSSEWMQCAIDRAHFQRRVQLLEELFTAL